MAASAAAPGPAPAPAPAPAPLPRVWCFLPELSLQFMRVRPDEKEVVEDVVKAIMQQVGVGITRVGNVYMPVKPAATGAAVDDWKRAVLSSTPPADLGRAVNFDEDLPVDYAARLFVVRLRLDSPSSSSPSSSSSSSSSSSAAAAAAAAGGGAAASPPPASQVPYVSVRDTGAGDNRGAFANFYQGPPPPRPTAAGAGAGGGGALSGHAAAAERHRQQDMKQQPLQHQRRPGGMAAVARAELLLLVLPAIPDSEASDPFSVPGLYRRAHPAAKQRRRVALTDLQTHVVHAHANARGTIVRVEVPKSGGPEELMRELNKSSRAWTRVKRSRASTAGHGAG